jgi:hypothetical protein
MAFPSPSSRETIGHMTWKPDEETARTYGRYRKALETERELRDPVREQAARDLHAGATVTQLAKLTGMTPEVFRRIARAEGVERKREPTVGREVEQRQTPRAQNAKPAPATGHNTAQRLSTKQAADLAARAFATADPRQFEALSAAAADGDQAVVTAALDLGILNQTDLLIA